MAKANICPECKLDIGLWPVIKAMMPNRIRCPYCGARLKYADTGLEIGLGLLIIIAFAAGSTMTSFIFFPVNQLQKTPDFPWDQLLKQICFALIPLVVFWPPWELCIALYMREHKTLIRADGAAPRQEPPL